MSKCGAFIKNKYYSDSGMDYVYNRLCAEFGKCGVKLDIPENLYASYPFKAPDCDFAVFWDKDVILAKMLEASGVRLFNSARAVEICDDKQKTYSALCGKIYLPETLCSPLVYDVNCGDDESFILKAESLIGYPAVVKENVGSQGRQVYSASNRAELTELHKKLIHTPHLIQRFVRGETVGSDTRVYIAGGKAVAAVNRLNTTDFRSNAALGGKLTRTELTSDLKSQAEAVASNCDLFYGSADFICENGNYVFIEANSSVYMKNAEALGINLAGMFAARVTEVVYG